MPAAGPLLLPPPSVHPSSPGQTGGPHQQPSQASELPECEMPAQMASLTASPVHRLGVPSPGGAPDPTAKAHADSQGPAAAHGPELSPISSPLVTGLACEEPLGLCT